MPSPKDDLPPLSARLLAETDRLQNLEREKRAVPISSPEFHRLANEVERRARNVFSLASEGEEVADLVPTGEETIDDLAGARGEDGGADSTR